MRLYIVGTELRERKPSGSLPWIGISVSERLTARGSCKKSVVVVAVVHGEFSRLTRREKEVDERFSYSQPDFCFLVDLIAEKLIKLMTDV